MAVELKKGGLHVTGTALWLDARKKSELSFVSHAHSDHIARHERVIATKQTIALMEHRLGALAAPLSVPYRKGFELGSLYLELFPAGHVLGSAQLRITRSDGHRIVYTGDFSLQQMRTAEAAEIVECDTLVMESTFGLPHFAFPSREDTFDGITTWAQGHLARGVRPILFAYSLGKSQEAIAQLEGRGLKVVAHPSIHAVTQVYQAQGLTLAPRLFDGTWRDGEVGLFPPFGRSQALKKFEPKATAVLTGWAMEPWAARRYGADVAFPVSDHADYAALVKYAKESGATEVIAHHGYAKELAASLRLEGVFARSISQVVQMELPLLGAPIAQPVRPRRR